MAKSTLTKITVLVLLLATVFGNALGLYQPASGRITEDDPRWDCHTMGNKICGPQEASK